MSDTTGSIVLAVGPETSADGLVEFLTALSTRAELMVLGRSTPGHAGSRTATPVDVLVHHHAACPVLVVPPAWQPAPTFAVTGG